VACLVGILQLLDEYHYKRLWEVLMGPNLDRKPLKEFLMRMFQVFRHLVKLEVFPPDWLVIKMVVNNVMLKSSQELAQPLAFKFLDSRTGYFDKEVSQNRHSYQKIRNFQFDHCKCAASSRLVNLTFDCLVIFFVPVVD
jgi:hypothetical protein